MIEVTKYELEEVRKKYPNVKPVITSRKSSHKKYYIEENMGVVRYVNKLRSSNVRGGYNH